MYLLAYGSPSAVVNCSYDCLRGYYLPYRSLFWLHTRHCHESGSMPLPMSRPRLANSDQGWNHSSWSPWNMWALGMGWHHHLALEISNFKKLWSIPSYSLAFPLKTAKNITCRYLHLRAWCWRSRLIDERTRWHSVGGTSYVKADFLSFCSAF